jgi:hypothetical protein
MPHKKLVIAHNSLDQSTWETILTDSIAETLFKEFDGHFPTTSRLYHNVICEANDVTPFEEADVKKLEELEGTIYCVVYPAAALPVWVAWVAFGLSVGSSIYMYTQMGKLTNKNTNQQSPNNSLSGRTNSPRLGARIPDVYGTVQATPDLLSSYIIYDNNKEVEHSMMCVGRGSFEIPINTILDGTTPYSSIAGSSLAIYPPNTDTYSGTPQLTIGAWEPQKPVSVIRSNNINGQTLEAINNYNYYSDFNINLTAPNIIKYVKVVPDIGDLTPNFSSRFKVGDIIHVLDTTTLDGDYEVLTVSTDQITLKNPELVNSNWTTAAKTNSSIGIEKISSSSSTEVIVVGGDRSSIWFNFVAPQGLYLDDGKNQYAANVTIKITTTPVNSSGIPTGSAVEETLTMLGSVTSKDKIRITHKTVPPVKSGNYKVKVERVTPKNTTFQGQVADEVKVQDLFSVVELENGLFGDVTIVMTKTLTTDSALAVKERKLNLKVTRKLPQYLGNNTFSTTLYPTNNAADILCAISLDKRIGNRLISELDIDTIYSVLGTTGQVATYFGTPLACEFSHTFDSMNSSFEEIVSAVAGAAFCTAYRRGSQLKVFFEKQTSDSTLLFNHRNKLPNSEIRKVRFGNLKDYDSLQYTWTNPNKTYAGQSISGDNRVVYYMPEEDYNPASSYSSASKVNSVGVRNKLQAYFHAHRLWNKIQYQGVNTEFTATSEAEILVLNERILVADNTRVDVQDGQVVSQVGLTLTLSQPINWVKPTMTLMLQLYDGSVESFSVTKGNGDYEVVLPRPPRLPLTLDYDAFATTTYYLTYNENKSQAAFLVTEVKTDSNMTTKVSAVAYDERFYSNDSDYKNGVVDINGNFI